MPGELLSTTDQWNWPFISEAMSLMLKKPDLRLQLTMGALTVELRPTNDKQFAKWMVAALTHASRKPLPPLLFRVHVGELAEVGVEAKEGDPLWLPCKLLYCMGGAPISMQLKVPAHFDDDHPVSARSIKLA